MMVVTGWVRDINSSFIGNETVESNYVYLFVDLFDDAFYSDITFRVNMRDVGNLYEEGDVWVEIKTNRYTKLNGYTITSANDAPTRDPRDWRLRGWNNESGRW